MAELYTQFPNTLKKNETTLHANQQGPINHTQETLTQNLVHTNPTAD